MTQTPVLTPHDIHYVVDGKTNKGKVFSATHELLRVMDVFPHGVNGPAWDVQGGDTVPGLYLLGDPQWSLSSEDLETVRRPYGWCFIPMGDYEGKEAAVGRAGIGAHGGGHLKDHWDSMQELAATLGCVRFHNADIKWLGLKVQAVHKSGGKCWMTVTQ